MVSFSAGINGAATLNVHISHCRSRGMCSGRPGIPGPAAPARMWFDFMLTRQNYRATPQFLDTEQLRAQQLRIKVITQGIPCVP